MMDANSQYQDSGALRTRRFIHQCFPTQWHSASAALGGAPSTSQHPDPWFCCHMAPSCCHWARAFTVLGLLLLVEVFLGERSAVLASSIPSAGEDKGHCHPTASPHLQSNLLLLTPLLPTSLCSLFSSSSSWTHSWAAILKGSLWPSIMSLMRCSSRRPRSWPRSARAAPSHSPGVSSSLESLRGHRGQG